jgi:hypothetical protein
MIDSMIDLIKKKVGKIKYPIYVYFLNQLLNLKNLHVSPMDKKKKKKNSLPDGA